MSEVRESAALAVLEEVLSAAIQAARTKVGSAEAFDQGLVMAYYDVLSVAKEQAELLGVQFGDQTVREFDPESLLAGRREHAAG